MKPTDPRDSLDQKIDKLLASQPAKTPNDFAKRILAEIDEHGQSQKFAALVPLVRLVLPLAAVVTLAFIVFSQLRTGSSVSPARIAGEQSIQLEIKIGSTSQADALAATGTEIDEELDSYEIQEILMLQEGLSGFAQGESDELNSDDLLTTLNTLYSI